MNRATPTADAIPVNTCEQALRHYLKKLFRLHVGLVQALRNTIELFSATAAYCKIFRETSGAEKIRSSNEGLVVFVKTSNNRFAKIRTKTPAIQHGRYEFETSLRGYVAFFAEIVPMEFS
jgi:hypothetical protein